MNYPVTIREVKTRMGASNKLQATAVRLIAVIGPQDYIIHATSRLLRWWPSGNYSSQAAAAASAFHKWWDGVSLTEADLEHWARKKQPGCRGVAWLRREVAANLEARRAAVYNRD